ncbi:MAG: tetratricopeptide repeat protein [Ignavibacteriaceae bacterium]|jgi:tetratricopeptide (TPR) repeat protein|nr:tetratricopeptide repeat protein [Ignavibacteriaceae bacterium]MCW8812128.1 tetratricopeptide repeat protein [Chlorobium sp.]MCW8817817.1 tetratricopeptide repeat protein [Ignavibacteriaceae bacterium]MCW8961541.1 tetratricopeptide repeat protein [Ignavibacteriaceae bacterium]MCW9094476.1 tetratricopeptide repeat protein [Ignavibacteriaceae bacterium]
MFKGENIFEFSLRQAQTDIFSIFKQTLFVLFIIFFSINNLSFARDVNSSMQQAGENYRNAEYDKAINIYEQLISEGYKGTSLYYNLANSYYRIGKLGYAILNYERALKISPSDEDVKHNLAFANLSTVDRIQPLPTFFLFEWWETVLASLSVNGWTYAAFIFYLVLLLLIILYFFARTIFQQKIILFSGLGTLIVLVLIVSLLVVKINREQTVISGVIVDQSTTVKTSPDPNSTDAFVIHEGLKLNLEDRLDEWVKIKLADGKVGWIENNAVEEI